MVTTRNMVSTLLASIVLCAALAGSSLAAEPQRHVIGAVDIQAQIDAQGSQVSADHQAIQSLLERPAVRQIAASAGLDLKRASAAASVLSGDQLTDLAARARTANSQLSGGHSVTLTYGLITIILLIIIILIVA